MAAGEEHPRHPAIGRVGLAHDEPESLHLGDDRRDGRRSNLLARRQLAVGRAVEDGLAGVVVEEKVEGRRSWRASGKLYRLDRQGGQVSLRVEPASVEIKKPTETGSPGR